MYVPIVQITIKSVQNAQRPAIEKTERNVKAPEYMVNLFKAKWGRTAQVEVTKPKDGDDLWLVPELPNMSVAESEVQRLKAYFGEKVFLAVYREHEFIDMFDKLAVEENPRELERAERDEANRAAAVKRAAQGIMQAAGDAEVQAVRARGAKAMKAAKKTTRESVPEPVSITDA
jgi:hypothetical protein